MLKICAETLSTLVGKGWKENGATKVSDLVVSWLLSLTPYNHRVTDYRGTLLEGLPVPNSILEIFMLVVFEGIDGVGKSSIAAAVRKTFMLNKVVLCSDPCREHPATLALRQYILARGDTLSIKDQVQLYEAARLILYHDIIKPAIDSDALILCDRLWLSTWVYQGVEVEPFPEIDLLIYLDDKPAAVAARMATTKHWDNPDITHLENLSKKYMSAIQKAVGQGKIKEVIKVDSASIELAANTVSNIISARKKGLRLYDRDFAHIMR